jgi:hypothetical protein
MVLKDKMLLFSIFMQSNYLLTNNCSTTFATSLNR